MDDSINVEHWDLIHVSKEEFQDFLDACENTYTSLDTHSDEYTLQAHYTDEYGRYIGSICSNDDGTVYLVPEVTYEDPED